MKKMTFKKSIASLYAIARFRRNVRPYRDAMFSTNDKTIVSSSMP